ncbi:MAG TPA: NAD(P)H-hydrate dehydratase [Ignavibacteria bacterium]|nr:NAD(P)H-hydrate dehydratase [Ignavibacteria bacterium]
MENILDVKDVLNIEKNLMNKLNLPSLILMENAGLRSADFILQKYNERGCSNILILLGKGNNAGDGMVIARHLISKNIIPYIYFLYPQQEYKNDAKINYDILKNLIPDKYIFSYENFETGFENLNKEGLIIVDAVFGVGFKGTEDEITKKVFDYLNHNKKGLVIAIDVPSGLSDMINAENSILKADYTLSMGVKRLNTVYGGGREFCGEVVKIELGIIENEFENPLKIFMVEKSDVKEMMPAQRKINSNKYSAGKVFVLAGSRGYTGAGYLSSMSALRTGAGAVIIGFPESLDKIFEIKLTEVIKKPLPENKESGLSEDAFDEIIELIQWSDVTLIGPGLGRSNETQNLIRNIVQNVDKPLVIDADGLYAFKGNTGLLKKDKNQIIITPHYGEFANLLGINYNDINSNFVNYSKKFAAEHNLTLILKNSPSLVTQGNEIILNSTGSENLATVGSGDVLAGIVSGIYSQSKDPLKSAAAANYIHGMCSDILKNKNCGNSVIAGDLIEFIPQAIYNLLT